MGNMQVICEAPRPMTSDHVKLAGLDLLSAVIWVRCCYPGRFEQVDRTRYYMEKVKVKSTKELASMWEQPK